MNQFRVPLPQSAQNIIYVKIIRSYLFALLTVAPISNNSFVACWQFLVLRNKVVSSS